VLIIMCFEGLGETLRNLNKDSLSLNWGLNPESSEYEAGVSIAGP
jgi:hypothetical protein